MRDIERPSSFFFAFALYIYIFFVFSSMLDIHFKMLINPINLCRTGHIKGERWRFIRGEIANKEEEEKKEKTWVKFFIQIYLHLDPNNFYYSNQLIPELSFKMYT